MFYRRHFSEYDIKKVLFIPVDEIEEYIQDMFISVEDHRFYSHCGISIEAMLNAYRSNRQLGYDKFGGSTITQQLARTLFLIPVKSYFRKYLEIITALTMELVMSKKRILELYINYAELGRGIFGIGSASLYYYTRSFYEINRDEIIRLIAILPNPLKYNVRTLFNNYHLDQRYRYLRFRFD